jgi:hypothetical protein
MKDVRRDGRGIGTREDKLLMQKVVYTRNCNLFSINSSNTV